MNMKRVCLFAFVAAALVAGSVSAAVYPAGEDDSRAIVALIERARAEGRREVVVPQRNAARNRDYWIVAKPIELPSGTRVILDGARLVLADDVFCNVFVNEHAWKPGRNRAEAEDRDIEIVGRNGATLDGGNYNGWGEQSLPWKRGVAYWTDEHKEARKKAGIGRLTGNSFIYFHNVKGFRVEGLRLHHQRYWATCFSFCEEGVIRDLRIEADISWASDDGRLHLPNRLPGLYANLWVKNGDGIDLRKGCHHVTVENVSGWAEDDIVAMTNLCGGDLEDAVEGKCHDIHHVTVRNIRGGTWLWFNHVRLLCGDGARIHDILVDGVYDEYDPSWMNWGRNASAVQVNDASTEYYRTRNCAMGELRDVTIRNIRSGAGHPIRLFCPMENVTIENVHLLPGARSALGVQAGAEFRNVRLSGVTADESVKLGSLLDFYKAEGELAVKDVKVGEVAHVLRNIGGNAKVTFEGLEIGKVTGERTVAQDGAGGHWFWDKVPRYQDADELWDVVVVGGGPAGIAAALSSAKCGARTALVERDARLGGTTVSAEVLQMGLFHAWRKQVIAGPGWDLVTNAVGMAGGTLPDFSKQEPRRWWESCVQVNPSVYSALAAETAERAGVELRLCSEAFGAERTPEGWRLSLATGEGVRTILAREVVDATGNAAIAALAGAERVQEPEESRQPGSYFFHLNTRGRAFDAAAVDAAQKEAVRKGELLPTDLHVDASAFIRNGGGWGCYVYLADNSTAAARADTNRRGREAMMRILRFIRRQPGLQDAAVVSAAPEVGVRETYRIAGEATILQDEYLSGVVHPDSLCYSYWMIDPHDVRTKEPNLVFHEDGKVGTIRLGALLPKGVPDMLVAGRAVSSDHGANSALRVQASCMAMGQVAGVTAALAARQKADPRTVPLPRIREGLRAIGAILP